MIDFDAINQQIDEIDQQRKKYEGFKIRELMPLLCQKRMVDGRLMSLVQLKISAMQGISWELHSMLKRGGILPYDRH